MPEYTYGGDVEQTYPQYIDVAKGSTLVAEPGETYAIAQVPDRVADGKGGVEPLVLPMPPDGRWTEAKPPKKAPKKPDTGTTTSAEENG